LRLLRDPAIRGPSGAGTGSRFSRRQGFWCDGAPGAEPHRAGHHRLRLDRGRGGARLPGARPLRRPGRTVDPPPLSLPLPRRRRDRRSPAIGGEGVPLPGYSRPAHRHGDPAPDGRTYGPAAIYRMLDRLRAGVPDLFLRTSLIVGFPGETRAAFDRLLRLSTRPGGTFSGLPYSRKRGLRVPDGVAGAGADEGRARAPGARRPGDLLAACNASRIGQTLDVLVEKTGARERRSAVTGTGAGGRRLRDPLRIRRGTGFHCPRPCDRCERVGFARVVLRSGGSESG